MPAPIRLKNSETSTYKAARTLRQSAQYCIGLTGAEYPTHFPYSLFPTHFFIGPLDDSPVPVHAPATGTPMQNNMMELYCVFDLIIPGCLGAAEVR